MELFTVNAEIKDCGVFLVQLLHAYILKAVTRTIENLTINEHHDSIMFTMKSSTV